MPTIIMTGGGTSGHVTPNIALIPKLKKDGYEIHYIGTKDGIENNLITQIDGVYYHDIKGGKLRRYISYKNLIDTYKVMHGFVQAYRILRKLKPDIVLSKGGYVSSPVVWAAKLLKIPVVIHESDYTVGLANKLSIPFATKICYSFKETKEYLPKEKSIRTGIPIREQLFSGNKEEGIRLTNFKKEIPVIVVMGGSLGSRFINDLIRDNLNNLTNNYQICHICGKGNIDESLMSNKRYKQYEYVNDELSDLFALADLVITRGGATVLFELLALNKKMLIIPLSKHASRGDQILNARSFYHQGYADYIQEEDVTDPILRNKIDNLITNKQQRIYNAYRGNEATINVIEVIKTITYNNKKK